MKRIIILLSLLLLSSGCASYKSSKKLDTTSSGVALRIQTNYRGIPPLSDLELWVHKQGQPRCGIIHMKKSGDLIYLNIPQGRYVLSRVDLGNYYLPFPQNTYFDAPHQGVAYIGDLHIKMDINLFSIRNEGMWVADKYPEAQRDISRSYPSVKTSKNIIHLNGVNVLGNAKFNADGAGVCPMN